MDDATPNLTEMTTDIVSAYLARTRSTPSRSDR